MNPLSIVESWMVSELLNDATLTGIIGANKVYYGSPPDEAGSLYVLCTYVDARPFYNLGVKRDHSWAEYDIMAWQSGENTLAVKTAADRIDVLFSIFRNRTFTRAGETYRFYSRLMRPISRKDTSVPPLKWRGMGGTYKVSATKQ